MKILVISLCVLLSGCSYQVADSGDILFSREYCEDKGGINHITIYALGTEKVECNNGAERWLDRPRGTE